MNKEEQWLLEEKYSGEKSEAFFADCKRLEADEPLAYVIGHVPFLNCQIYLANQPLIPRSETEFWVEKAIAEIGRVPEAHVLDLCAGSGAIGVAVAKATNARITFAEIDADLTLTIEANCAHNQIPERNYYIIQSDLFSEVTDRFDFILSNPPYIDPALDRTEESVKIYEPHLALYGGADGLEVIEKIIKHSPSYLNQNGQVWIEHEPEQTDIIHELASNNFKTTTHVDQYDTLRYSILMLK